MKIFVRDLWLFKRLQLLRGWLTEVHQVYMCVVCMWGISVCVVCMLLGQMSARAKISNISLPSSLKYLGDKFQDRIRWNIWNHVPRLGRGEPTRFDKRSEKQNAVTAGREKAGSTPPVVPGAAPALAKAGVGGFCSSLTWSIGYVFCNEWLFLCA